jgi:hypothetical protein
MYFYANSGFHASLSFHKEDSPWRQLQRKARNITLCVHRVLTTCFQAKREELTGGWRKLHNQELHGLSSSPYYNDQIKKCEI